MNLDYFFESLKLNGSKFELELLKKIKNELEFYIDRKKSIEDIVELVKIKLKEKTEEFLYNSDKVISAISSSIFINSRYWINIIGGTKSRNGSERIDEDTLFDIASITKMYTGLLLIKLKELKLIDYDKKLEELTNNYKLKNYSIADIINMTGIIKTPKRLDECESEIEALREIKNIYVESSNKNIYNYTDMGLIVLTFVLEEIFNMPYKDILNKYLLSPLGLRATYSPYENITGNGRTGFLPNDPKAVILNRPIGSAGIFTNSFDLISLSKCLFNSNYFDIKDLLNFCINKTQKPKGAFGSYTKHPLGLSKTYVPNEYSDYSFAFEGFTGSMVVFDLINKIHNSVLVNAVYEDILVKHNSFNQRFNLYQRDVTESSLKLLLIDKCFNNDKVFIKKVEI